MWLRMLDSMQYNFVLESFIVEVQGEGLSDAGEGFETFAEDSLVVDDATWVRICVNSNT